MNSLVFIDARLRDADVLLRDLPPFTRVVAVDPRVDALSLITRTLADAGQTASLHILCHGAPGTLQIGSTPITEDELLARSGIWPAWRERLADDAEIVLYGCELAAGTQGIEFVHALSALSARPVIASSSRVGAASSGGSWDLDTSSVPIRSGGTRIRSEQYAHTLAIINGTVDPDWLLGTFGDDTITGGGGNDTIDGAAGNDTASFAGTSNRYRFGWESGYLSIEDTYPADGNDGIDYVRSIETLSFSDRSFGVLSGNGSFGEFQVNTYTPSNQQAGSVAVLEDGGWVVTWASYGQDGNFWGVYAQRYDATGARDGDEFRVNSTDYTGTTLSSRYEPRVAALEDGGYVITWASFGQDGSGYGIYAQRYDVNGATQGGEFRVNTTTATSQLEPSIVGLADGDFVIVWSTRSGDGNGYGVFGQRYNGDGSTDGSEFQVNTHTASDQENPDVAATADGGYIVAWQSAAQDGSGWGVYAQRYDADGNADGAEFAVANTTANHQFEPSVAVLSDGSFVVAWRSNDQDGSGAGVFARLFAADGTALGDEFAVNTYTTNSQFDPQVSALAGGGFVVTWTSVNQDGSNYGVYAQRFDGDGDMLGGEFRVNTQSANRQWESGVDALPDGGFVTTWSSYNQDGDGYGIFAQRFDANGSPELIEITGTSKSDWIDISGAGDLGARGGAGNDTYVVDSLGDRVIELPGEGNDTIQTTVSYTLPEGGNIENLKLLAGATNGTGNSDNNFITGNNVNNLLQGLDGNDTLLGGGGDDTVLGGAGSDALYGNEGSDTIDGGTGGDTMFGGDGDDLYYVDDVGDSVVEESNGLSSLAVDGITLDGWLHVLAGAGSNLDTVISQINYTLTENVEILILAASAGNLKGQGNVLPNILNGNESDNFLAGLDNNDTLNGGMGKDTLDGGVGADSLTGGDGDDVYIADDLDTLVENPGEGNDTILSSATRTLAPNFENLTLTGNANINATGNADGNQLIGNDGNNSISGAGGDDTLYGGGGSDTLNGGTGNDTFLVGAGDTVQEAVGEGTDTVLSESSYTLGDNVENLVLTGSSGNSGTGNPLDNVITGNDGNNELFGLGGKDTLYGGEGNDTLNGGAQADEMHGGAGNDEYQVTVGDVVIEEAGGGIDLLRGAIDWVLADNVENMILGGTANASVTGNSLENELTGNNANNTLDGQGGRDNLNGRSGDDTLIGGGENDTLFGVDGLDKLYGNQGNDTLVGGGDADSLYGGQDDDVLRGNLGNDELWGQTGADYFVFDTAPDAATNVDTLGDFTPGTDKIRLSDDVFQAWSVSGPTAIAPEQFVSGDGFNAATTAEARIIYDTSSGALYYDQDGTGAAFSAVQFAVLDNKAALSADDFQIIT